MALKIKIALSFLIVLVGFTACQKDSDVVPTPNRPDLYAGYLTYSKIQKAGNHDPVVNLQTSWQEVEVTFGGSDSIYFKIPYLPTIGFACNDLHEYELHQGTTGRTEISISTDTIRMFHMEKSGSIEEYLEETWEFEGIKTK